jgi:hypothetical protein
LRVSLTLHELGELILVDDFPSDTDIALSSVHYPLAADFPLPESRGGSLDITPVGSQPLSRVHSRLASREEHFKLGDDEDEGSEKVAHTQRSSTPLTVVIRHSDDSSRDGFDVGPGLDEETLVHGDDDPESPGRETSGQSTAEKAGVILVSLVCVVRIRLDHAGHSQHFHCPAAIPSHFHFGYNLLPLRAIQVRFACASCRDNSTH